MQKSTLTLIAILLLAAVAICPSGAQTAAPFILDQKVTVSDLSATVTVQRMRFNWIAIGVRFESSSFVSCLSVYKDLRYKLRDEEGTVVPISQETLNSPPFEGATANHVTTAKRQDHQNDGCAPQPGMPGVKVIVGRTFLSDLYPHLAPGKYTLHITFAPRDLSGKAELADVPIEILANQPAP